MAASRSVAILGGGISGLTTAYYLLSNAAKHSVSISKCYVLESQSRFGGWLHSRSFGPNADDIFELGPRTISTNSYAGTNVVALAGDIGLGDCVKAVDKKSPNFSKRFVAIDGKLFVLPSKLIHLFQARKPFKPFISYMVKDWRTPPVQIKPGDDMSVDAFFRYRFAPEIADYLVNPLCIGITGGNSSALSMQSMFPNVLKKEQKFGSVVRGMFSSNEDIYADLADHWLVKKSVQEKWAVFSFDGGVQRLPDRLCTELKENYSSAIELMPDTEVTNLTFTENKVMISADKADADLSSSLNLQVDHVFSSIPAFKLASLLSGHEELKSTLKAIPTVHMAVVSLQFDREVLPKVVHGFGFLVPLKENSPILGVTFDSCIFQSEASQGTKLTVMLGGYRFKELFGEPETVDPEHLKQIALGALKSYLKIQVEPVHHLVSIHQNCIAQYTLNHGQRVETIENEITKLNMSLLGASYHGFSVPDCILNAKRKATGWLQEQQS